MRAAEPSRLRWLRPKGVPEAEFAGIRSRLESLVVAGPDDEVYGFADRSIYRAEDAVLGPVAIKESRFPGLPRQLGATLRRHRVLCEFRVAAGLQARGVATPRVFGAALERRGLATSRCLVFTRWVDDAPVLNQYFFGFGGDPPAATVRALAGALVGAARAGLVHGRHAPKNILVLPEEDPPAFQVIDFSHSQLGREGRTPGRGLVLDTARIAWRLAISGTGSERTIARLFDDVAQLGWGDTGGAERARAELDAELRHLHTISKRRQRLERVLRTLLRGLPTRI
ncbi:MAG: lipopolysaccharide kinase InaA family protein [Myxococcota bacterium]|nr:lipopolysaccharide kinase InaA family protein [Myxococcota bacterium]